MKVLLAILNIVLLNLPCAYAGSITLVQDFGSNPGGIKMYKYVSDSVGANAPLVVSLHGCLQDAETYSNVGWKELADKWKFYVIFPEQDVANNRYRCWNWFQADEIKRGYGEAKSIIEMINKMKADYSIDSSRIYIEGLSAGGWMVSVMLASYPDVFAGGATNAGGPAFCVLTKRYFWDFFGWWNSYVGGLRSARCMAGTDKSPGEWGNLVRSEGYTGYRGRWPIISIWQGAADGTVNKINQQELVDQWTNVHGIDLIPEREEKVGANSRVIHREYHNAEGKVLVETYLLPDMNHGTPITVDSQHTCGTESTYILNEGICAVRQIGLFWGLDK